MKNIFNKRFSLLYSFISTYVLISFGIRISLYALSFDDIDFSLISIIKIFSLGFFFDLSVALFFSTIYFKVFNKGKKHFITISYGWEGDKIPDFILDMAAFFASSGEGKENAAINEDSKAEFDTFMERLLTSKTGK